MKRNILFIGIILLVTACSPVNQAEPEAASQATVSLTRPSSTLTQTVEVTQTPTITRTVTPTSTPTVTPIMNTPTITPTPWPVVEFETSLLQVGVSPQMYVEDTCQYLQERWGEGKSAPGTIVVPIMFHSVAQPGRAITDDTTISLTYFEYFMAQAADLGFETVTMAELVGFLMENQKIPEKSMIMILDDRRPGVTELFMPYLEANDWTLTLAWPTTDATDEALWARMEALADSGYLDIQSHGHDHIYLQWFTPVEEVREEIYQPIEVIQNHFGTKPISIMWPGGNFTAESIQMAHEAGLQLGFTAYSRGPLMFNWIPLGEPEIEAGDPLMVLPRYWSIGAVYALEHALSIQEAAQSAAEDVREQELLYYSLYCQSPEE